MDRGATFRWRPKARLARHRDVRVATLAGLLVLLCVPSVVTIASAPNLLECDMKLLFTWRDPAGGGRHLLVDVSEDGSRLLLVDYGAPDEVRVTNRTLATLATLSLPGQGFAVKGAVWSQTEQLIVVWGRRSGEGRDSLLAYDATTYAASDALGTGVVSDLVEISALCMFADDMILGVAGRDANGTSVLLVIEAPNRFELRRHPYLDNTTVSYIGNDGRELVCTDLDGGITSYYSTNWTQHLRYELLSNGTTAQTIQEGAFWVVGDGSGRAVKFHSMPPEPEYDVSVGAGPVQGVVLVAGGDLLVAATPAQGGGSRIDTWLMGVRDNSTKEAFKLTGVGTDASVTMLSPDPVEVDWFWAAFEDGSISVYEVVVRDIPSPPTEPPIKDITEDEVVLPGLELLKTWDSPAGGGLEMDVEFSSDGSRLALLNFGAPGEVRMVDRYLRNPRILPLPDGVLADAVRWSPADRWLAVYVNASTDRPDQLLFYNSSTLERVEGWDFTATFGLTSLDAGTYMSDDSVIAVSGVVDPWGPRLLIIDLEGFSLISSQDLPSRIGLMMVDGEDLVLLTLSGETLVISGPGWTSVRHAGNLSAPEPNIWDYTPSDGWLLGDVNGTCHAFTGTGWGERTDISTRSTWLKGVSWTRDVPAEFVTAGNDKRNGSYIRAWCLHGGPNGTGPALLAETHTVSRLVSLRSDPASPGTFMASFKDGTLRLYHVAVPGASPAPDLGDDEPAGIGGLLVVLGMLVCLVALFVLGGRSSGGREGLGAPPSSAPASSPSSARP